MANNNLTPESDLATRKFFVQMVNDETYLRESPASRKSLIALLLEALNYTWLPNGSFVERGQNIKMPFGTADYSDYPNEWEGDKERAREAIANNNKDTIEASPRSEAPNTEVREAVLSKDL